MPKDRRYRWMLAPCGLSLVLAANGCRSTKSDVPGPALSSPPVSFSHDASPPQNNAFGGPASPYGPGVGSQSPGVGGAGPMSPFGAQPPAAAMPPSPGGTVMPTPGGVATPPQGPATTPQ